MTNNSELSMKINQRAGKNSTFHAVTVVIFFITNVFQCSQIYLINDIILESGVKHLNTALIQCHNK